MSDYAELAQILTPIIALIGIMISMWLSVKALREVQKDRKLRQMPHLAFEYEGGGIYSIEFVKIGTAVPGLNPNYVKKIFNYIPKGAESINLKSGTGSKIIHEYGKLRNFGLGTALSTEVTWVAQSIQIGTEIFEIGEDKLLEPPYRKELNCIPASPSHILPGEIASFYRLPTFINKDYEKR